MSKFTIYVLCYGDSVDYAERALNSIVAQADQPWVCRIVVATHAATEALMAAIARCLEPARVPFDVVHVAGNPGKYVTMHGLFHRQHAPTTEWVMWFDDDSYCVSQTAIADAAAVAGDADLVGQRWEMGLQPSQQGWLKSRSWYAGQPLLREHPPMTDFCQGAWWCLRTVKIVEHAWPIRDLVHRGGDVALGLLARQQGWRVKYWSSGFKVNADMSGKESPQGPGTRRGISNTSPVVGMDWRPGEV